MPLKTNATKRTKACDIPPGRAVIADVDGTPALALKTERVGKDYIHHYVIPIDPRPAPGGLALIYLDPDDMLDDLGCALVFEPGPAGGASASAGDLIANGRGLFLKVHEDPKSQKLFAYIEIATGVMFRRQERGVEAVHCAWSARIEAEINSE